MWSQEAEQRQAAEEAAKTGEDANDLEKAQDFGRLRTMKVQQARVTGVLFKSRSAQGPRRSTSPLHTIQRMHNPVSFCAAFA